MTQPNLNPAITDSTVRSRIEGEVLDLARRLLTKPDACLDFEGINFANPTPEAATLLLILQNITKAHREFSLVNFKGGVALVRTQDVDKLSSAYQGINEKSNMIIRGGTDKSADLMASTAAPINAETNPVDAANVEGA